METLLVLVHGSGQQFCGLVSENDCLELFHQEGEKGDGKWYQNHE